LVFDAGMKRTFLAPGEITRHFILVRKKKMTSMTNNIPVTSRPKINVTLTRERDDDLYRFRLEIWPSCDVVETTAVVTRLFVCVCQGPGVFQVDDEYCGIDHPTVQRRIREFAEGKSMYGIGQVFEKKDEALVLVRKIQSSFPWCAVEMELNEDKDDSESEEEWGEPDIVESSNLADSDSDVVRHPATETLNNKRLEELAQLIMNGRRRQVIDREDWEIQPKATESSEVKPAETEETTCVVCMENKREIALTPCNHLCLCAGCANKIEKHCPLCNTAFVSKMKIFF
jgi:Zinc finger, C3HC4 type (RING finger)